MKLINKVVERFNNIKYARKLLVSFILTSLIPLIGFSIFTLYQSNRVIKNETGNILHSNVQKETNEINGKIDTVNNIFQITLNNRNIANIITAGYDKNYKKYLDIVNVYDPYTESIMVFNSEIAEIRIYTDGSLKDNRIEFLSLEQFEEDFGLGSGVITAEPFWCMSNNEIYVLGCVNGRDANKAILVFRVDYDYFFKENFSSYMQIGLEVSEKNGAVLFANEHYPETMNNRHFLYEESEAEQAGWLLRFSYDKRNNWLLSNRLFIGTILVVMLSILFFMVFMLLFTKSLSGRINNLNVQISNIIPNGFKDEISSGYSDEIGEISNNVGKMVVQTRQLIVDLEESGHKQAEAEIMALQSQINPHFLYNSLSMINWRAMKDGNKEISDIATNLSRFYRSVLNKGDKLVSVYDELANTKAYMGIQLLSKEAGFDFICEEQGHLTEYYMPNLILQPILENAVEHGLATAKAGVGKITLSVYEDGDFICFSIIDNGQGMTPRQVEQVFSSTSNAYRQGVGIKNVNRRLALFFEDNYEFIYKSELGKGTDIFLKFPKCFEIK